VFQPAPVVIRRPTARSEPNSQDGDESTSIYAADGNDAPGEAPNRGPGCRCLRVTPEGKDAGVPGARPGYREPTWLIEPV